MREAKLIVPVDTAKGNFGALIADIATAFGGVTVTKGHGTWRDTDGSFVSEPVNVVTVAMDTDTSTWCLWCGFAVSVGINFDQSAVYVQFADGEVKILERGKDY